jgi:geranylgeranyl pyrophosphate synthase
MSIGYKIGFAFQLMDDLLDMRKKGLKPAGNDIKESKKTVLLKMLYDRLEKQDKKWLQITLNKKEKSTAEIEQLFKLYKVHDLPAIIKKHTLQQIAEAKELLDDLPIQDDSRLAIIHLVNTIPNL